MELRFLGAATTVTGSQFLLTTSRAKVLIDCGMFQGNPHETIRNRVPLSYDASEIDALVLTHAHLDHCGLIPLVVAKGMRAPIFATAGTIELATLVLLDSAKLQHEAAKRDARFERKNPDRAARVDRETERHLQEASDEAAALESEASAEERDPETVLRGQPPRSRPASTTRSTPKLTRRPRCASSAPLVWREIEVAPGCARDPLRRGAHPRLGDRAAEGP